MRIKGEKIPFIENTERFNFDGAKAEDLYADELRIMFSDNGISWAKLHRVIDVEAKP